MTIVILQRLSHRVSIFGALLLCGATSFSCNHNRQIRRARLPQTSIRTSPEGGGSRDQFIPDAGTGTGSNADVEFWTLARSAFPAPPLSEAFNRSPLQACRGFLQGCDTLAPDISTCAVVSRVQPTPPVAHRALPWPAYQLVAWRLGTWVGASRPDRQAWSRSIDRLNDEMSVASSGSSPGLILTSIEMLIVSSEIEIEDAFVAERAARCATRAGDERCADHIASHASQLWERASVRFDRVRGSATASLTRYCGRGIRNSSPEMCEALLSVVIHLSSRLGDLSTCESCFEELSRGFPTSTRLSWSRLDLAVAKLLSGEFTDASRIFSEIVSLGGRAAVMAGILRLFADRRSYSRRQIEAVFQPLHNAVDFRELAACLASR